MTDATQAAVEAITHQPALPLLELPEYHGRKAAKMKTALTGAGSRITRPHSIGDKIILVIEARVKSAGHEDTDDGLEYVEKVKVLDLFELAGDTGSRLISTVRSLYRTADDQVKGKAPIGDLGDVGYADGSGVVLTPAEVAELRGDPVRAILSSDLTPAVIVYSDGARELWPDLFPKDTPRPKVGDRFDSDGGEVEVVRVLHHDSGEDMEPPAEIDGVAVEHGTPDDLPTIDGTVAPDIISDTTQQPLAGTPLGDLEAQGFRVGAVPPLPGVDEPDDFSGDLGDNVAGWEDPDPATAARLAAEAEERLPSSPHFALVDQDLNGLKDALRNVADVVTARKVLAAEEQGRGRGLKPRAGALAAIRLRIGVLEDAEHQAARAAQMEGEA